MRAGKKKFPDHSSQINRIQRIKGQLDGIGRMIEENRYCVDILTQIKAIGAAIRSLEASILERHLGHCVKNAFRSKNENDAQEKITELLSLFKKTS